MPKNLNPILGSRIGGTGTPGSKRVKKIAHASTAPITKGDIVAKGTGGDTDKWARASTTSTGPFAMAMEDAASAATTFSMVDDGEVLVTADGAITPNSYVMRSGTTAGQVVTYSGDDEAVIVGRYLRHEGEDGGDQTDAADGEIIVIRLGQGQAVTAGAT
jgi:hypothetical protein